MSSVLFSEGPFLTETERAEFKRLRGIGTVTIFNVAECAAQGCDNEVPRNAKLFCSKACWLKEEGPTHEKEEDETGAMD